MPPRVLLLDNSLNKAVYSPVVHWGRHCPVQLDVFCPPRGQFPSDISGYSHIIISGSEASITVATDWMLIECEFVRRAAELGVPMLASCYGHQLVVRAISGQEFVRESPTPEFGWLALQLNEVGRKDPLFAGLPSPIFMFTSHFDEVHPLPPDWLSLGSSPGCQHSLVRWKQGRIWGIQHHPEIDFTDGQRLLDALLNPASERSSLVSSNLKGERRDSEMTGKIVERFLGLRMDI